MKTLIFFDTNFIKGAKPFKKFMDILVEHDIFPFTSELIISELKGQRVRELKDKVLLHIIPVNFMIETRCSKGYHIQSTFAIYTEDKRK